MPRSRITTQFAFEDHNASVLQRVNRGVSQFSSFVFSPAGAIAGAAALAAGLGRLTSQYLNNVRAVNRVAASTKAGTQAVSALIFAFERFGYDSTDVDAILAELEVKTYAWRNGVAEVSREFEKLNLDLEDFDRLSPDAKLREVARALSDIESGSGRIGIADAIFGGDDARKVLAIAEDLDRLTETAIRTGNTIDEATARAAKRTSENLDTIQAVIDGAGTRIGAAIVNWSAPILEGVGTALGILPKSAEAQTEATFREFVNKLADARSTGLSLGEALTDPVLARLDEMVRQAGIQTAAALAAANDELARRSAAATAAAYSERRIEILQDIELGSGERIRPHRNLPVPPGSEADFQPTEYDYDLLAGGGPREPFERRDHRTYSSRRFALFGTAGNLPYLLGSDGIAGFAQSDPASAAAIRAFVDSQNNGFFSPFANKEQATIQTEAIRANQVVIESPLDGGRGGFGGGGRIDGQGLIDASKNDPVRVTVAGIGGLNEGAGRNQRFREIRIDENELINRDGLVNLVLAILQDYTR